MRPLIKSMDGKLAVAGLLLLGLWLFVVLPILHQPETFITKDGFLGVKVGEWLLFAATMGLWWATWQLVRGAKDTAERQLRAYISCKSVSASNLEVGRNGVFLVKFRNGGQTPAYAVNAHVRLMSRAIPILSTMFALDPTTGDQKSMAILGPGDESTVETIVEIPILPSHLDSLVKGQVQFFVFGRLDYCDAYGRQRTTRFRLQLVPESIDGGKAKFAACPQGNEAT
jgi:hypothetical protein